MKVKYGDSRGDTNTKARYPGCVNFREIKIHGRAVGKKIERNKLSNMVVNKMAIQDNNTEWYIVPIKTWESLWNNWEINTQENFITIV